MPLSPEAATALTMAGLTFGGLVIFLMGVWQERRWRRDAQDARAIEHPAE